MEEMTREKAVYRLFTDDFDCGQCVFAHFAEELDIDEETALKLASAFGGGMHRGEVCGCVIGGLLALGMKYGFSETGDEIGRNIMRDKSQKYMQLFEQRCGSVRCRELLGADVSTDEGKAKAGEIIPQRCPDFIVTACDIIQKLLED